MLGWCSRAAKRASSWKRASWSWRGEVAGQDHLEGHGAVEVLLPGLVDDAHAAAAELALDFVLAEVGKHRHGRTGR